MDIKNRKDELINLDVAIKYAQVSVHNLQGSSMNINHENIKEEMIRLHKKIGKNKIEVLLDIILSKRKSE